MRSCKIPHKTAKSIGGYFDAEYVRYRENQKISFSSEEYRWIEASVKKLKSNFVTMDLARCEDGRLIIMELGDGQVSGLQQIKPAHFYKALKTERG